MVLEFLLESFINVRSSIPDSYLLLFDLFLYTTLIAIYSVFIWKFYKFLARRNIIELNLNQYNHSMHPTFEKFLAVVFFTVEYVIILPFLVLFWFTVLSLFLLVLSENQNAHQILLISAAIIASTRIAAYISGDLARDLAKIFPFTVLALFVLEPNFFNTPMMFEKLRQIPGLFTNVIIFIVFIFAVEFILRGFYSVVQLMGSSKTEEREELVAETKSSKK